MTECPKCGYARKPADTQPETECPGCGVIYERYLEAQAAKRNEEKTKPPASPAITIHRWRKPALWLGSILSVLLLLRFGGTAGFALLFFAPLGFYLYKHRNDLKLNPTAACPACGGVVAIGIKACPHCGHKKPYPKPVSKATVAITYSVVVGTMVIVGTTPDNNTGRDAVSAHMYCERLVKSSLKAPSSAKFASFSDASVTSTGAGKFRVVSYVDAQNSFGAMIRNSFACLIDFEADKAQLEYFN
ncbi:hypothetical protein [Aquabacterium sp. A08]|uniref:hypothetical protein n=1 Tax=Aquabacterium sp. A08 TaxID=2718532 RepID=UPI00141F244E|nr:hypothetical protein [Aquabacterium sp. A08]NIC42700.1 hypothetical protein [Aquabacterium sp. A08]